jgi:hypothetical protein
MSDAKRRRSHLPLNALTKNVLEMVDARSQIRRFELNISLISMSVSPITGEPAMVSSDENFLLNTLPSHHHSPKLLFPERSDGGIHPLAIPSQKSLAGPGQILDSLYTFGRDDFCLGSKTVEQGPRTSLVHKVGAHHPKPPTGRQELEQPHALEHILGTALSLLFVPRKTHLTTVNLLDVVTSINHPTTRLPECLGPSLWQSTRIGVMAGETSREMCLNICAENGDLSLPGGKHPHHFDVIAGSTSHRPQITICVFHISPKNLEKSGWTQSPQERNKIPASCYPEDKTQLTPLDFLALCFVVGNSTQIEKTLDLTQHRVVHLDELEAVQPVETPLSVESSR